MLPSPRVVVLHGLVLILAFACSESSDLNGPGQGGAAAGGSASGGSASGGSGLGGTSALTGGKAGTGNAAGSAPLGGSTAGNSPTAGAGGSSSGSGGVSLAGAGGSAEGGADSGAEQLLVECLDAPVIDAVRTEALRLEGDGVSVAIVRRVDPDGVGTSGTTVWLPERFGVVHGATAQCVSAVADLKYTVSHHNFDDSMSAAANGQTWLFKQSRLDYGTPAHFTIEAKQDSAVVWGPLDLTLVTCRRLDTQQDCIATYQPL